MSKMSQARKSRSHFADTHFSADIAAGPKIELVEMKVYMFRLTIFVPKGLFADADFEL